MSAAAWLPFLIGWIVGWCLVARPRQLPDVPPADDSADRSEALLNRAAISFIIPARNEADSLPHLLDRLVPWLGVDDELIVIDDRSSDATAAIARTYGAQLIRSPGPRSGWLGKPYACWLGQQRATNDVLVFLDADVRPAVDFFDRIDTAVARHGCASVLPWHTTQSVGEQVSLFPSIAALMGSGEFSVLQRSSQIAFGPVMAVERSVYDRVGGHGAPTVRGAALEDVALARLVPDVGLYTGARRDVWRRDDAACVSYRMYPGGVGEAFAGWSRTLSTGLTATTWWAALGTIAWVWAVAAAPFVGWWAVLMAVVQIGVIGRLAGRFRWWAALVYPLLLAVFVAMVIWSFGLRFTRQPVTWKGRRVRL